MKFALSCIAIVFVSCRPVAGETLKDIEFANMDGHSLTLDLYLPEKKDTKPPLVVYIHGGGWRGGSKEKCEIKWLAEHGFAVASISYRLTDKAIFPAQIHDCKGAVRWLRAHAEKYGFRKDRVAVTGSSAGGHLAALLGTTGGVEKLEGTVGGNIDQSSRADSIIDFYGATDFIQRIKNQPHKTIKEGSIVNLLLGGPADQKLELAKLASASFHVTPDDPPLLIFHGANDNKVLPGQSERIRDEYEAAGLPVTLHILEKAGHGGAVFYSGESKRKIISFLEEMLMFDPLFDGETLSGWHTQSEPGIHGTGGNWGVTEKGILFGEQDPPGSGNGGLLLTDEKFDNFEIVLSLRPDWGPDSGIFLRTNDRGEGWQVYVDHHDNGNVGHVRLETKVHSCPFRPFAVSRLNEQQPALKSVADTRTKDWPEGVYEETCSAEEFLAAWNPEGWNRMKIRCAGEGAFPVIETWINDVKICKLDTAKTTHPKLDREKAKTVMGQSGRIGFQVHKGKGWPDGARVFWKDIRIRRLD